MPENRANDTIPEALYRDYLAQLLRGNRSACGQTVGALLDGGTDIRTIYLELLQRSLYDVGELWESNRISVATEHVATAVTEGVMAAVYPRLFHGERCGRRGVVSCISNEYHQIGGRMVADILELNGWDGWFLGASTPERDLIRFVDEKRPDLLCLSLAIYFNLPGLLATIDAIRSTFPRLDILVGGQAFRWGGIDAIAPLPEVTYVPTLSRLEALLQGASR